MNGDQIYARADTAVRIEILRVDGSLAGRWRAVAPDGIMDRDNWLVLSARMVARFNRSTGLNIAFTDAARAGFHDKRLIEFVVAIADKGDAGARAASADFVLAGF